MTAHKKSARPSLTVPEAQPEETTSRLARQFESAFIANWSQVYRFLLHLVGDQAEAEDLALETFLRLYRRPPEETAPGSSSAGGLPAGGADPLGGWLHRVAANLGLNAIRSWKRRQRYELEAGAGELWERQLAESKGGPAELFQAEEERQQVRRILAQMAPRQARLLILKHSGLRYREIAAELGVAPTSIGPLLARAEEDFEKRFRAAYLLAKPADPAVRPAEEEDHASD